jgi:hypothetical protein
LLAAVGKPKLNAAPFKTSMVYYAGDLTVETSLAASAPWIQMQESDGHIVVSFGKVKLVSVALDANSGVVKYAVTVAAIASKLKNGVTKVYPMPGGGSLSIAASPGGGATLTTTRGGVQNSVTYKGGSIEITTTVTGSMDKGTEPVHFVLSTTLTPTPTPTTNRPTATPVSKPVKAPAHSPNPIFPVVVGGLEGLLQSAPEWALPIVVVAG